MKRRSGQPVRRRSGLTLIEMTLVIATMALMVGLAVPAARALRKSFQTQSGVKSMIEAALSSARAMALSSQNYVGVRFQKLCTSDDPANPLKNMLMAPQYMIFIRLEETKKIGLSDGFRAVEGLEPIKLPETMGVMDLSQVELAVRAAADADKDRIGNAALDQLSELSDATTFSIVFSPAGKLLVHAVRVRNRDGVYQPKSLSGLTKASADDVFNSVENICLNRRGMFLQDDYSQRPPNADGVELGLGQEDSRTSFVIYDAAVLQASWNVAGARTVWTTYLSQLPAETWYVSPYAGNLIASH